MNDFNKLVKAQDEYIALLVKEIESMVSIAYMHGWRSDNHEAGSLLREKIASLKQDATRAEQEGPKPISSYLEDYNLKGKLVQAVSNYKAEDLTVEKVKSLSAEEIYQIICSYSDAVTWLDSTVYALEEGAGEWETEAGDWKWKFEAVFAALKELTALKAIKEKDGETVDYLARKPKAWATAKELTSGYKIEKREQEGLRWVKATMFNYTPNSRYYARWGDGDGAIKSTGWFQQSDGTFFWNENGFVPVLKKEHDQLYILDESTPPVKEAGQPAGEIDIAKYTLWVFTEVVGWDKADHTFRLHGEIEHRPISDLYPKYLESQNNKP